MVYFWPIFCSVALIFVIWSAVSAKLAAKRSRKARERLRVEGDDHLKVGCLYNIGLIDGKRFDGVKFLGLTDGYETYSYLPHTLASMLIVEQSDGRRAYVRPKSIVYYEDAAPRQT